MGYEELIEGLRAEADEKIRQLWNAAREEAGRVREEAADRIDRARKEHRRSLENAVRETRSKILVDAEKGSGKIILEAEKALSVRLFSLALTLLDSLRNEGYEKVFSGLAGEIPSFQWKEVRVAPGDMEFARGLFPDARIVRDDSITGGLEVHSENGKISIANTFEKRLERAWGSMLPRIVQDVYKTVSDERTP